MARSMTGFGRGEAAYDGGRFVVEMRAVNHRFSEVVVRLPRQLNPLEDRCKKAVLAEVGRGRVDVYVNWEETGSGRRRVKVDKELALAYYSSLKELGLAIGSNAEISSETIARMPDVLVVEDEEIQLEALSEPLAAAVARALVGLVAMREREGVALTADVLERAQRIEVLATEVAGRVPVVVEEYRERLDKRLAELLAPGSVDPARLAMEVAVLAERADISEELERLRSHLSQLRAALATAGPVGRKLDFLVQEMGREINTTGSKASDLFTSRHVVEMKSELERIREQVQNIE